MRFTFLLVLFSTFSHLLTAQVRNDTDSLLNIVATAPDSSKVDIYLNLAVAYRTLKIDRAYEYALTALQLAKENELLHFEAEAHNILGSIYRVLGEYEKASTQLHEALKLNELLGNVKGLANTANSLGILYFNQKDYENALTYYNRAFSLADTIKYRGGYATFCLNIGEVYQVSGDYKRATELLDKALVIFTEINDLEGLAYSYGVLAKIKISNELHSAALANVTKALQYFKEDRNDLGYLEYSLLLCEVYQALGKLNEAENHALKAMALAQKINTAQWRMNCHLKLSKLYEQMFNYDRAYHHTDSALLLKTSILDQEKQRQIANLRIVYQTEQYMQENELLKVDKELKEKRISRQQAIVVAITICLLAIIIVAFIIYRSNIIKQRVNKLLRIQNQEILQQRKEIQKQAEGLKQVNREMLLKNELIEGKNKNIYDSLHYAKKIQTALLPARSRLDKAFDENFILYRPKDIVSGDFYWLREFEDKIMVAVADCTGHGIPGAFMSFIGHDMLNYICNSNKTLSTDDILNEMRTTLIHLLRQDENNNRDGMDISLCIWDKNKRTLEFAGANHCLIFMQHNKLHHIKGDRATIGKDESKKFEKFTKHTIDVTADTTFYLYTDGYIDQFGGTQGKKFMLDSFKELINANHQKQMSKQERLFSSTLDSWMEKEDQVDDILVFAFRLTN